MRQPAAPLWASLLSANESRRLDSKIEKRIPSRRELGRGTGTVAEIAMVKDVHVVAAKSHEGPRRATLFGEVWIQTRKGCLGQRELVCAVADKYPRNCYLRHVAKMGRRQDGTRSG